MTLKVECLNSIESRLYARLYIAAVRSGEPFGISTLRGVLKLDGVSIFGVNSAQVNTLNISAIASILESSACRAYGPLADILRAIDAEENTVRTLAGKKGEKCVMNPA